MKEIKLHRTVSLIPPVYYELSRLKENTGSYIYYQTRHPAGLFSLNFQDAINALNALLLEVNNMQALKGPLTEEEQETLKKLTIDFLFKLLNYFESGYEIFLAYSPEDTKPTESLALHKWFSNKSYKDKIAKYYEQINPLLEKYRLFFNGLKHSSNQISIFHFFKENTEGRVIGFYLEGVNDLGAISPVTRLHPTYKSEYTAWSYNFHLRIFYFLLYAIAEQIEEVVKSLYDSNLIDNLNDIHNPLTQVAIEIECNKAFGNAMRFDGAYGIFFPQEAEELTKTLVIVEDSDSLTFSDYKPKNIAAKGTGYRGAFRSRGDNFSRSWTLLYKSGDEEKMENEDGNCKNCSHSFKLHQAFAHDKSNLRKGGIFKCGVMDCLCELPINFNVALTA